MPATEGKRRVIVCDACLRASCWNGLFYCEEAKKAGTMRLTVAELRRLKREHPSYFEGELDG